MKKDKLIPKRRFKEFKNDDAWEQRKLSELTDVRDGTHDSPKFIPKGHPFITSKNVKNGYINYDEIQYISEEDFNNINKRSKVNKNDILMGMIGTIGNIALVRKEPDFAIKNVALIKYTEDIYYLYLYHYLQSSNILNQLSEGMDGGTQKFIALNKIRNLIIFFPKLEEQKKISSFINHLDNLITLHQRKLKKLKGLKLAYLSEMFPEEGEKYPKRRFYGFTDPWEQRKFEDVFFKLQNNSLSRAQLNYEQGIANNVHYGDILTIFGECLDVRNVQLPYINNDNLVDKYRTSFLKNGDIVFADAAEDETVGKCTEILGLTTQIVISGLHTIPCRPIQSFGDGYLGYYLNSDAYHDQLLPLMQGTKVSSISRSALDETYVIYPKSKEEQEQIGILFSDLDNLITLHQRKLEKLENIKKAYLNEIFV